MYGERMTDQLSATDWLKQGLKTLTTSGFVALKAEPLAKAMGVSRGSFYWHFADVAAFHAALLDYWREVAAERVIAALETEGRSDDALRRLIRTAFDTRLATEAAIRGWAMHEPLARKAVDAIDRRRVSYIASLLEKSGWPSARATAQAQILYWAFVGFTLSDRQLARKQQQDAIAELIRVVAPQGRRQPGKV